jgi:hypothetical protein
MEAYKRIKTNSVNAIDEVVYKLYCALDALEREVAELKAGKPETAPAKAPKEPEAPAEAKDQGDVEDIDALREQAKKLGVKSWHVKGADKLREAIKDKLGA